MNRSYIIGAALEAGLSSSDTERLMHFARMIANAEREECAKLCDSIHYKWRFDDSDDSASGPRGCRDAIRARND